MNAEHSFPFLIAQKRKLITDLQNIFHDSPKSFEANKNQVLGYVCGYCDAKGWKGDPYQDILLEFLHFIEKAKVVHKGNGIAPEKSCANSFDIPIVNRQAKV